MTDAPGKAEEQADRSARAVKAEAVVRFAGGIAHDLNNLLMTILGNSEMLMARLEAGSAAYEMAALIEEAGQRAAELARRLQAVGQRQALRPQPVDLERLAAGLAERLRAALGESIAVAVVAGGTRTALVDPAALEAALSELVANARDAMPGGGRLRIALADVDVDAARARQVGEIEPGRFAAIAVSDDGAGMPPEIVGRAFDPFFSTRQRGRGRGLGLSVVEGFARQSGGWATLASTPGQGTTVTIHLPAAPA